MKKIRGNKSIGVIIHVYTEISQGNSLCSYLYFKQAKMSCVSFYLFFFLLQNRIIRGQTSPAQGRGTSGKGEELGKGDRRVNLVQ
jgi:hypothetical protein